MRPRGTGQNLAIGVRDQSKIVSGFLSAAWRAGGEAFWEERDRWPLWTPVAIGMGIALYYALNFEPDWSLTVLIAVVPLLSALVLWRAWPKWSGLAPEISQIACLLVIFCLLLALGFVAAKVRTARTTAPVIEKQIGPVDVVGEIMSLARQPGGGWKVIVAPEHIDRLSNDALPERIRLTIRQKAVELEPGQKVRLLAVINPPPGPIAPGAFDFARQAWFKKIGGFGYTLRRPEILTAPPHISSAAHLQQQIARIRLSLAERIRTHLPGTSGTVAAALITGDRDAIPEEAVENLRVAGLAHLLAISGLHMGLVAGMFFAIIYTVLAAIEPLALRYPIRKWAALGGLLGGGAYLILSGGSVSTQRAYIMLSLMFIAVLLDRPVLSMRTVALAATVILLATPDSLLSVSFQMSFSAVIALIAFYEWHRASVHEKGPYPHVRSRYSYWSNKLWLYGAGVAMTTLITDMASAPFAAFHFNRVAAYGLAANLAAMPLAGILIMPALVLALILTPFGLEEYALIPMGWGIDQMLAIAETVASWEGAERLLPSWPNSALALMALGGLWLCIWRRPWRLAGGLGICAGIALAMTNDLPDILIDREGKIVAMRDSQHELQMLPTRKARFTAENWLRREGENPKSAKKRAKAETPFFTCDSLACVTPSKAPLRLSYVMDQRAFEEDCQVSDIIVSTLWLPWALSDRCNSNALIIDRAVLAQNGAYAIWIGRNGMRIENTASARGDRPWSARKNPRQDKPAKRKRPIKTASQ